jgi:hypothetical protein
LTRRIQGCLFPWILATLLTLKQQLDAGREKNDRENVPRGCLAQPSQTDRRPRDSTGQRRQRVEAEV